MAEKEQKLKEQKLAEVKYFIAANVDIAAGDFFLECDESDIGDWKEHILLRNGTAISALVWLTLTGVSVETSEMSGAQAIAEQGCRWQWACLKKRDGNIDPQPDPIHKLTTLLAEALRTGADQVRVVPSEDRTQYDITFAVNGNVREQPSLPDREGKALLQRIKLMAGMNMLDSSSLQSGRIMLPQQPGGEATLWFVESLQSAHGEGLTMLITNPSAKNGAVS